MNKEKVYKRYLLDIMDNIMCLEYRDLKKVNNLVKTLIDLRDEELIKTEVE